MSEIGRRLDLRPSAVWRIIKQPKYAGKVKVDGEYVDAPFDVIIPFKKWLKAQAIIKKHANGFSAEARKKKQIKRRNRILLYLSAKSDGARFSELRKMTGYPKGTLGEYLRQLREEGAVEYLSGKWHIKKVNK